MTSLAVYMKVQWLLTGHGYLLDTATNWTRQLTRHWLFKRFTQHPLFAYSVTQEFLETALIFAI